MFKLLLKVSLSSHALASLTRVEGSKRVLASTSRGPSPLSLQATTRALHTHTFHCHTNTYSSTRTILRRNSCFHTRETPNGAYFHVGKYPTGHKTQILRFHQRDSPDCESLLGVIDGLITGPLPLNRTDTGQCRLRPYITPSSPASGWLGRRKPISRIGVESVSGLDRL